MMMPRLFLVISLVFNVCTTNTFCCASQILRSRSQPRRVLSHDPPIRTAKKQTAVALGIRGGDGGGSASSAFVTALDMMGTSVFAFSGALTAARSGMDLLGVSIIATVTSVGGGTLRDILLNTGPVFWMRQPAYLVICVITSLGTFFWWPKLEEDFGWKDAALPICYADAVSLGTFAVVGTQKAIDLQLNPVLWIVCGLMTATFGGVTRDVICHQQPRVMYPNRTLYGPPAMLGSAVYALLYTMAGMNVLQASFMSIMVTFYFRVLSFNNSTRLPSWKGAK